MKFNMKNIYEYIKTMERKTSDEQSEINNRFLKLNRRHRYDDKFLKDFYRSFKTPIIGKPIVLFLPNHTTVVIESVTEEDGTYLEQIITVHFEILANQRKISKKYSIVFDEQKDIDFLLGLTL